MSGPLEPVFTARPGYRRFYPDLPGMGASPAGAVSSSDDMLAVLLEYLDGEIGADTPFVLIGESYGGYLARGIVASRPEQVLGLGLICPVGTELENAHRDVPPHQVLVSEPGLIEGLDPAEAEDFGSIAVVQTAAMLERYRADVAPGLAIADDDAMSRIRPNWALTTEAEPYTRPTLILCGRQDSVTGYAEQYTLLPHYPRATYAVLDVAGHNLQLEQPALLQALVTEWLDRIAAA